MSEAAEGAIAVAVPAEAERTGEALLRLVAGRDAEITVGAMAAALGDRAFGILILALALPNCVFAPPGLGVAAVAVAASVTGGFLAAIVLFFGFVFG